MITFQNLAAQLRSLCHGPGNASRMAPAQIIDSEVMLSHTTHPDRSCLPWWRLVSAERGLCST